ncbi:IclR family transcriptional regulator [Pseudonocardia sp. KRD-182]|uniref:IclR family transcriptional regulator n=1 Tax=Pseudonocardia oceani TaxID=2792013 RepID=UPI001C4A19C4|nr:IclR family transcriptional regulator [Pseudonocardia oceani]MBW0107440.1 IclR family transcriptional regulator [Pseudonocardia oceani]
MIDKAADVLAALAGEQVGVGVSELARRAGLSKSTTFRVLGALERTGMVDRVGSGYRVGALLRRLGRDAPAHRRELVRDALVPHVADLFALTGQTVHVAVLDGPEVVYLTKIFGHRQAPVRPCPGDRFAAHAVAVGQVLLAFDRGVESTVRAAPLPAFTPRTTTDPVTLLDRLSGIRSAGIGFDADEARIGVSAVAVPLRGPDGAVVAALSITHASADPAAGRYAEHVRNAGSAAARSLRRALVQRASSGLG